MNKPAIEIVATRSFSSAVADELVMLIRDAIDEHGKCTIALAGGSTPGSTYRLLSRQPYVSDIDWANVYLFWGDERWVGHDDTQSNYRMSRETLIDQVPIPEANIFPVDTTAASPEAAAEAYSKVIRNTVRTDGDSVAFDLILLGIGDDGHTASLFPHSPVLSVPDSEICVATTRPDGATRITLTPGVLKAASQVVFLVSGETKAGVVQKILQGPQNIEELPASLYHSMTGSVSWFLDTAAATRLEKE